MASQDAGFERAFCPSWENPACATASDCQDDGSPPQRCQSPTYCLPYNAGACLFGQCVTRAEADVHNLRFDTIDISPPVMSFAGLVVAAETAGGEQLGCDAVYGETLDLTDACVNILDSRSAVTDEGGSLYTMSFNRFVSGLPVLFVVYGFGQEEAQGAPLGVSCTEQTVLDPTGEAQRIGGDRMRPIQ